MKKLFFLLTLSMLFLFGCSIDEIQTNDQLSTDNSKIELQSKGESNGIIHHVSAGGNDACEAFGEKPGCDRNYSLVANMHSDGSVKGQFIDGWPSEAGWNGVHADIKCMVVDGNMAKVGGVIKKGYHSYYGDITGWYMIAVLKDNGTSKNDAPDEISFTFINSTYDLCEYTEYFLSEDAIWYITRGQIKIW